MKRKDIITILVCVVIMGVAVYFGLSFMGINLLPKKAPAPTVSEEAQKEQQFTGNIDQDTLDTINKFNDYGEAGLENIGRVNPFAPLN